MFENIVMQEECGPFVCGPTVCSARIAEHMFSTQELKQKRLFVIIHSFVSIGSPTLPSAHPPLSHIQTKALVEIVTAQESEARMTRQEPSTAPRGPENCFPQSGNNSSRFISLLPTRC